MVLGKDSFGNSIQIGGKFDQNGSPTRFQQSITGQAGGMLFSDSITERIRSNGRMGSLTERFKIGDFSQKITERFDKNGNPTSATGRIVFGGDTFQFSERGSGRAVLNSIPGLSNRLNGIPSVNNDMFSMKATQQLWITAKQMGVCSICFF
jgi:hypothetical protein